MASPSIALNELEKWLKMVEDSSYGKLPNQVYPKHCTCAQVESMGMVGEQDQIQSAGAFYLYPCWLDLV